MNMQARVGGIRLALGFAIAITAFTQAADTWAGPPGTIHYPDLEVLVPIDQIVIEWRQTTRWLSYTHIISNFGEGNLEIRPDYNPVTDSARGYQRLYTHDAAGTWMLVSEAPIVGNFYFHAPHAHYHFPFASYGLYQVNPDGSVGAPVAMSDKVGYCIADDVQVDASCEHCAPVWTYSGGSCDVPTAIRGITVGWGDLYDRTDIGQSIDITNLADGVYWFRTIVDPYHYFSETSQANNITDLKLRIAGSTVTVLEGPYHPNSQPPVVTMTAPPDGASLSNTVTVSATATDPSGIANLQFLLDGNALGPLLTSPPYTFSWDTRLTPDGPHFISAQATAGSTFSGTARPRVVTVANGPPPPNFGIDRTVFVDGSGSVTTPTFNTAAPEALVAFVASDGPGGQTTTVSGAALSWALIQRANTQNGTAEIWSATAAGPIASAQVTSTPTFAGFHQSLTVVTFANTGGVGASALAGAPSGAPSVSVTTTRAGSLVLGVGNDWDGALARVLGPNQTMVHQMVDNAVGDTFWVQRLSGPAGAAGTVVTLNDTAPTADRWNMAAVELVPNGNPPPLIISNIVVTDRTSSSATVRWPTNVAASSRVDYGVAPSYGQVATAPGLVTDHAVPLTGLSAQTTYHYRITSQDAFGHTATTGDLVFTTTAVTTITCSITAPPNGATVWGVTSVSADASGSASIVGVQFKLDGANLGQEVTTLPYRIFWDTGQSTNGSHTLTAVARDPSGNTATSQPVQLVVSNPPPALAVERSVYVDGVGTSTTQPFDTAVGGDLLVAFVSSDGPGFGGGQAATVSGAALTWTLVRRENTQAGTSEIWKATAASPLRGASVTSTQVADGFHQSLTVVVFASAGGTGASAGANAGSGAPAVNLTTTRAGSLVYGVGNDWDSATARVLGPGQMMVHQLVDTPVGDTFWVQAFSLPIGAAGTSVTLNDTQPTADRWNFAAVEVVPVP